MILDTETRKEKSWFVLQRHGTTCFGHTGLRCSEGSDPRRAFSHISSPLHLFPGDISHILYDALGIFPRPVHYHHPLYCIDIEARERRESLKEDYPLSGYVLMSTAI